MPTLTYQESAILNSMVQEYMDKEQAFVDHLEQQEFNMYVALQEAGIESLPDHCLVTWQAKSTIGQHYLSYTLTNKKKLTGLYDYRPYGKRSLAKSKHLDDIIYKLTRIRKGLKVTSSGPKSSSKAH